MFSILLGIYVIGEGNGNPLQCSCLENPRDGEPGGLPSMGLHRVGHDWSDLAAAAAGIYVGTVSHANMCLEMSSTRNTKVAPTEVMERMLHTMM